MSTGPLSIPPFCFILLIKKKKKIVFCAVLYVFWKMDGWRRVKKTPAGKAGMCVRDIENACVAWERESNRLMLLQGAGRALWNSNAAPHPNATAKAQC